MKQPTDSSTVIHDGETLGGLELFLYVAGVFVGLLALTGAAMMVMSPPSVPSAFPGWLLLLVWLIGGLGLAGGLIGLAVMLGRQRALLLHSGGLSEQIARQEEMGRLLDEMETLQQLLINPDRTPPPPAADEPEPPAPVPAAPAPTPLPADIEAQSRRATDLMAASRFDDAVALVEGLLKKFPDHDDTRTLLARVRHEAQTYQEEQCNRYYELIQEHAQNRNWVAAVEAAHRLIHDFPDVQQADEAKVMMPTLVDNARLQEVRDYRHSIRTLLTQQDFEELVKLGEYILDNYPETALADELRTNLPRWRQGQP
jgi:tetratricopeptide (TPR) repeat protein